LRTDHQYAIVEISPATSGPHDLEETAVLKWAIIFAIIALVSGGLGFTRVSGAAATIAKVLFAIFLILFLIALLAVIGIIHLF